MAGAKKKIPSRQRGAPQAGNVTAAPPPVPIGLGGPGPTSVEEWTRWMERQPRDVQEQYDAAGLITEDMKRRAFLEDGVNFPGVSPTGDGLKSKDGGNYGDKKRLARAAASAEVTKGRALEDEFAGALTPEDYAYQATLDQGAGYSPQDRYRMLGQATPLEQALQEQAINQSRTDDTGLQAQQDALAGYRDIYGQGGLTALDRARMETANRIGRMRGRAAEEAVMRDAAEQGRAGGNLEFIGRLGAQQAATQQISDQDLQTQAMALARKDAALGAMANTGQQVQSAQDAIDQFNAEGERARVRENLDRENFANTATWNENNSREHGNADQFNRGVDLGFASDTARSSANTDRQNSAAQFNASPSQGVRGMMRDRLGLREAAAGRGQNAAGLFQQGAIAEEQNDAAKQAAIIGAVGGLANAGIQSGVYAATQPPATPDPSKKKEP